MALRFNRNLLKKILLCLLAFSGYVLGIAFLIHSQTFFLVTVGPEQLPFVMVLGATVAICYSLLSSAIGMKLSPPLKFAIFTIFISAFYGIVYLLPQNVELQALLFFLMSSFFFDFLDISVINVSSSLMTPLQAKNMLPLLNSFSSLGVIVGSYFALDIQRLSEPMGIGLLPAMSLLIVVLFALLTVKFFKKDLAQAAESAKLQATGSKNRLRDAFKYVFHQSHLFKTLAFIVFLFVAIRVSMEFKFKTTMSMNFSGEELTDIIGKVYMVESAIMFLVGLFLTEKLLFRFGIVKILLAYPVLMFVAGCVALALGLPPFFVVLFALSCTIPWYSIVAVTTSQIYSIAPKQKAQQVYFLIMGLLTSLTKLVMSLSFFVYATNIELERFLNTGLIMFFIVIAFVAILKFKNYFQMELKDNLFKEDVYLKHQSIELLAEKTQRNQGEVYLRRLVAMKSTDEQTRIKTLNTLGIIGNYETVTDLIKILKEGSPKEMFAALQNIELIVKSRRKFNKYPLSKHLLLKTYREIFISNVPHYVKMEIISALKYFNLEEVIDFLEKNLQNADPQVQVNIIETLDTFNDRAIILYLEPFLNSENVKVVASTVAALWKFPDMRIYLVPRLAVIMSDKSLAGMESSLFLIGAIQAHWEKEYVKVLTTSENDHIRQYAYITLILLGERGYLDELLHELVLTSKQSETNSHGVEFLLSQYRKFSSEVKELFISQIQQLPEMDVRAVRGAFDRSNYMFVAELEDLRT